MEENRIHLFRKSYVTYFSVSVFAIFIGSQITEGVLLVPYWQRLSSSDFYTYYNEFGPAIGSFYTILTIIAALIPLAYTAYFKSIGSSSLRLALYSSFLAILFVSTFFIYFKGTNELFFQSALSAIELQKELVTWSFWHWGRVLIECLSLLFLIMSFMKNQPASRD